MVIALLAVGAALVIRPAILGSQPGAVVAGVAIPGSDVATWGNLSPLIAGASQDARRLWPPVPSDAQTHPLASPPPSASSSTEFVFLKTVSGAGSRPVTWDPCRPIHLVVNSAQAPAGGDQLIREAAGAVSSATGLRLVVDGPTTEVPSGQRPPEDTARYGNQWSPVLVAWTDPSVVADLAGPVAGVAGPVEAPYFTQAQQHWVSGVVNLDGPDFRTILQRQDGWAQARATVMHEFGHLVGLAHTPGRAELMNAQNVGQLSFGAGDREGLRQLGLGPCFTS